MQEANHEPFDFTPVGYPPECYHPSKGYNGPLLDAWLLGSILFKLVKPTQYPFKQLKCPSSQPSLDFNTIDKISYKLQDLVRALLHDDEQQRLPVEKICKHEWFLEKL